MEPCHRLAAALQALPAPVPQAEGWCERLALGHRIRQEASRTGNASRLDNAGGFMLIRNTGTHFAATATTVALLVLSACSKTSDTAPAPTNTAATSAACNR